jgi:hypothetical protein
MASALFTVNGSSAQQAHTVSASATVYLALVNSSGVNTVEWSIVGQANATDTAPTISKTTATMASFAMPAAPAAPAHLMGFLIQCVVNGGRGADGRPDAALTCRRVVGTVASSGLVPLCANETTERNATVGWVKVINDILDAIS